MFIKIKEWAGTIREGERLERRNAAEWKEHGTVDEMVKLVEFKERKQRNTRRIYMAQAAVGIASMIALKCISVKEIEGLLEEDNA